MAAATAPGALPSPRRSSFTDGLRFVVAVDGSDSSKKAFETAASMWKKGDKVTVVHIADASKDYLPFDQRPGSIEDFYSTRCVAYFPTGSYSVAVRYKRPGDDTKTALMAFLRSADVNADLLFVGFTGRKGPKDDPTIVGSTTDYSMRAAGRTTVITKNREVPPVALYVVCVDGSERAHLGAELAVRCARPDDELVFLHVEDLTAQTGPRSLDADAVEKRYREYAASLAPRKASCVRLVKHLDERVADTILNWASDRGATYIVVGADGMGAYVHGHGVRLGSNSDRIVRMSRCTVICTQEKAATFHEADARPTSLK